MAKDTGMDAGSLCTFGDKFRGDVIDWDTKEMCSLV